MHDKPTLQQQFSSKMHKKIIILRKVTPVFVLTIGTQKHKKTPVCRKKCRKCHLIFSNTTSILTYCTHAGLRLDMFVVCCTKCVGVFQQYQILHIIQLSNKNNPKFSQTKTCISMTIKINEIIIPTLVNIRKIITIRGSFQVVMQPHTSNTQSIVIMCIGVWCFCT